MYACRARLLHVVHRTYFSMIVYNECDQRVGKWRWLKKDGATYYVKQQGRFAICLCWPCNEVPCGYAVPYIRIRTLCGRMIVVIWRKDIHKMLLRCDEALWVSLGCSPWRSIPNSTRIWGSNMDVGHRGVFNTIWWGIIPMGACALLPRIAFGDTQIWRGIISGVGCRKFLVILTHFRLGTFKKALLAVLWRP